jgi:hypothetical protein
MPAHQLCVAAFAVQLVRVHGRFLRVVGARSAAAGSRCSQPDAEKGGQVAVLHAVEIRRIGHDKIDAAIGQRQLRRRPLQQQKPLAAVRRHGANRVHLLTAIHLPHNLHKPLLTFHF